MIEFYYNNKFTHVKDFLSFFKNKWSDTPIGNVVEFLLNLPFNNFKSFRVEFSDHSPNFRVAILDDEFFEENFSLLFQLNGHVEFKASDIELNINDLEIIHSKTRQLMKILKGE